MTSNGRVSSSRLCRVRGRNRGEDLRTDHPLQGETFRDLTGGLHAIAQAIELHGGIIPENAEQERLGAQLDSLNRR
jgi:hypothetical protein